MNSVVVEVDTEVDILVVREVVVILILSVVVVG